MAFLRMITCLLMLVGCNEPDDSVWRERHSDLTIPLPPENAKIVDERTVEEPVLEGALDNLEQTPITISSSFTREATLQNGARLFSLSSASFKNTRLQSASHSELGHAIRAEKVPNLSWKKVAFDGSGDAK